MKIVISSNTSWSIYNFRLGLVKALLKKHKVILIAPKDKYSEKLIDIGCEFYEIKIDNKGKNPINDIKTLFKYYKLYKKIKPDLIFHYTIKPNIYGTLAAKLNSIPCIAIVTGLGYAFINENIITKIVKILYKFAFNYADEIWFLNKDDFEIFAKEKIIKTEKCYILPGEGIDTKKFKPIETINLNGVFSFLLIARMLWDKGIGEYVEAAKVIKKRYSNVEFLLLGTIGVDNPAAISKNKIIEWESKGIIKYLGTTDDVKIEIAKADCIVLPSYREGTSRVLLESAAMEKPIIASNVPGCNNIVDNGTNGFLCNVKDSKDLADKMEKMLNLNEKERKKMGKKGREKMIKEFDEKIVIDKYFKIIEKLTQK